MDQLVFPRAEWVEAFAELWEGTTQAVKGRCVRAEGWLAWRWWSWTSRVPSQPAHRSKVVVFMPQLLWSLCYLKSGFVQLADSVLPPLFLLPFILSSPWLVGLPILVILGHYQEGTCESFSSTRPHLGSPGILGLEMDQLLRALTETFLLFFLKKEKGPRNSVPCIFRVLIWGLKLSKYSNAVLGCLFHQEWISGEVVFWTSVLPLWKL